MIKKKRVTIKDVAAEAGVSITTVSHVLNEVPGLRVNPATQQRILDATEKLGYVPNRLAQSLRTHRSKTIGLIGDEIVTTPFAGKMILGVQEVALDRNFVLFVVSTGYQQEVENREIDELLRRQVDGIIYASMFHRKLEMPKQLSAVPTVFLNAECLTPGIPWVTPDEVAGGRDAASVLLEAGHTRLGYIDNVDDIPAAAGRMKGFRERLEQEGLSDALLVKSVETDAQGGYVAAKELLSRADRPTAIFCFNDRIAMGAYRAAAELELKVPRDVSIMGFDNQDYVADGLYPGLTTIELPHYEMGTWAAEQLFKLIDGEELETSSNRLRGPIITRDSVSAKAQQKENDQ
ncbi:MAG: LacI family DNA-binding transcriptional regulator [Actinomycetaceae bacterium]|nr:LacI family DNA-binding transcriptional regulator [Actinomycetaceae bacterium]